MCFLIDPKNPNAKIAEKDIVCYKILNRRASPHQEWFVYKKNIQTEKVELYVRGKHDVKRPWINEGYHSFKSARHAPVYNDFSRIPRAHFALYKMIIPKGTMYYENEYEYVSETIILKRKLFFINLLHAIA